MENWTTEALWRRHEEIGNQIRLIFEKGEKPTEKLEREMSEINNLLTFREESKSNRDWLAAWGIEQ